MMIVRSYHTADAPALATINNTVYPERLHSADSFHLRVAGIEQIGGRVWVIGEGDTAVGYAAVSPVPGLPGLMELAGFIAPPKQRQGLGGRLLAHLLRELKQTGARQLSHCVTSPDSLAAHFLRHHHFFIEHEEWVMILSDLTQLPPLTLPATCHPSAVLGASLQTCHSQTHAQFLSLYKQSFRGLPWYQPYSEAEVAATLDDPRDILFLVRDETPIGFVWTRLTTANAGEIEPVGVLKAYQGQGYGRLLLLAGLRQLANRGAEQVKLGVWRENRAAIRLYQSLGFQHRHTLTYLAYSIALPGE